MNRLVFIFTLFLPVLSMAHGVSYHACREGTAIEAAYDDGRPMAFCDVTVTSPANSPDSYQNGETDPHGRFAFVPDTNGLWKLTVDDGMGHVVTADVLVGHMDANGRHDQPGHDARIPRPTALVTGLSIIFGLFGIYSLARCGKQQPPPKTGCGGEECACTSPKE